MEVVVDTEERKTKVGLLNQGDVFIDDVGDVAIKLKPRDDSPNACMLGTKSGKEDALPGLLWQYYNDDEVTVVKATLTIIKKG